MAHTGDLNAAIKLYEQLLSYYPTDSESWADLGIFFISRNYDGDEEKAMNCYRKSLNQDENNLKALVGLMVLLHIRKDQRVCDMISRTRQEIERISKTTCGYRDALACENLRAFANRYARKQLNTIENTWSCPTKISF